MSDKVEGYIFEKVPASDTELERYTACFNKNGTERTLDNVKWLHQQNIPAISLIYMAFTGKGEVAAIYTWLPCYLILNNQKVLGMQSLDTLTDINHRGKGLFPILAKMIESEVVNKDVAAVYGFPNENSAPGFVKKLLYKYYGEVPFLIKPLGISYLLNKLFRKKASQENTNVLIPPGAEVHTREGDLIRPIYSFNADYDQLWDSIKSVIKLGVCRDSSYMNWRYINKPGETYSIYGYFKNNILSGVVIFCIKNKHSGRIGYLMELLYDPADSNSGKRLLKLASSTIKRNKGQLILAWCSEYSYNYSCYNNAGYFKFPEKLRPLKLGFIVKSLDKDHGAYVYDLKNWYLSYSDSDTV